MGFNNGDIVYDIKYKEIFRYRESRDSFRARLCPDELRVATNEEMDIFIQSKKEYATIDDKLKYWVIKMDKNHPLWNKFWDWINKKTGYTLPIGYDYYGYDGSAQYFTGFDGYNRINSFHNKPKLITLDEWDKQIVEND
jgi:hypothetical protein